MKPIIDFLEGIATSRLEYVERSKGRAAGKDVYAARGLAAPSLPDSLRAELLAIPRRPMSCAGAERPVPLAVENELGDGTAAGLRSQGPEADGSPGGNRK